MVLIRLGVRHGEGLGLMWNDFSFETNKVEIKRSWGMRWKENGDPKFEPTKGKRRREVDLSPELVSVLKRWEIALPSEQMGFGLFN